MTKYRKKPTIIEAIQYIGSKSAILIEFPDIQILGFIDTDLIIKTLEGNKICNMGDYIIKGSKGEFYICREDIFEATYENVYSERIHFDGFEETYESVE